MGHTVELSEHAYHTLEEEAQRRGLAPEALLESLIGIAAQEGQHPIYDDLDTFFRSFGATEEEIRDSEAIFQAREQARQGAAPNADL